MLPEQVNALANSGKTFTAKEIVDTYNRIRNRLIAGILTSQSDMRDLREDLYRQIKSLDAILDQLVNVWSIK